MKILSSDSDDLHSMQIEYPKMKMREVFGGLVDVDFNKCGIDTQLVNAVGVSPVELLINGFQDSLWFSIFILDRVFVVDKAQCWVISVFEISRSTPSSKNLKVSITSSGFKKGEFFLADVNTKLISKNITTDIKVDTGSRTIMLVFTTITIDEPAPGLKTILSFVVPDQKTAKVELQYLHEHAGISTSIGLTASPIVNFSGVAGTNTLALGTDVSYDTATGNFIKYNVGLSFSTSDLIASLTLSSKIIT
ncbi:mitochondrial outer membrane protein porin of 36 kDa-like [Rutidosis leptorrhynchoides]|uniref:mitochondrial outer membrane protein porin of 36 kDa-like n=1 Tax=Rutidosis leptorrhynchoides TaxID=125765 RepID=UPI003A9992D2